jgi:predicted lysophospholipase L1 biosynthesis ABC-type transport system permease subunit
VNIASIDRQPERRGRGLNREVVAVVGVAMFLALVVAIAETSLIPAIFVGGLAVGALVTLIALVGLIVRLVEGRKVDEVGVLLPVYLLGSGLFLYAPFVLYEAIRVGGCFE